MDSPNRFSIAEFIKLNSEKKSKLNFNFKKEIELILQKVLGCDRIDLYTKSDLVSNDKQLKIILEYIQCLRNGEPIQYILNQAPFYGNIFFVNKYVLIPRFDTELIIEILKKHKACKNLLEIGTGSGNIAITIAKENLAKNILATDISKEKIDIAKFNKEKLCSASNISFIIDDFLKTKIVEKFDIIVSNPPYIPYNQISKLDLLVRENEPFNALSDGNDGYDFYRKFASCGSGMLKENGFMLLEIGVDNKLEELYNIFCDYEVTPFNDMNDIPRVIKIY